MVESNLDTEKVEFTEVDIQSGIHELGFQRDPLFSGWCDENGIIYPDHELKDEDAGVECFDFELPLLQEGDFSKNMDGVSTPCPRNRNEKYLPIDIENGHASELNFSSDGVNGSNPFNHHEASPPIYKTSISISELLKTLFFILVWYTFSTFLTL